jgi:hypothetical protein
MAKQRVITGAGGGGASIALFLESSVLTGDFTKSFFPLATTCLHLGKTQGLFHRACATSVTCIISGQLTESSSLSCTVRHL